MTCNDRICVRSTSTDPLVHSSLLDIPLRSFGLAVTIMKVETDFGDDTHDGGKTSP
jgi:hypothetical protein